MSDKIVAYESLQWAWTALRNAETIPEARAIIKSMLDRLCTKDKVNFQELIEQLTEPTPQEEERFAIEIYRCDMCGHYPNRIMVSLPSKEPVLYKSKKCHQCGSTKIEIEKVYKCDRNGRITE